MKPIALVITMTLAVLSGSALAADTPPTPLPNPGSVSSTQRPAHLDTLKTHGASEIDRRLASLQTAQTKLEDSTQLSAAHKQTLAGQLQKEIDSLGILKDKLASETDLESARTDVQTIFNEYSVYAIMLPQVRLVATADRLAVAGTQLQDIADKLHTKIAAAKDQHKDTISLQQTWTNLQAKLDDAKAKYTAASTGAINLKTTNYAADHKTLSIYRDNLKVARDDFTAAQADIALMIKDLKDLKPAPSSPSPSASPGPSASPVSH